MKYIVRTIKTQTSHGAHYKQPNRQTDQNFTFIYCRIIMEQFLLSVIHKNWLFDQFCTLFLLNFNLKMEALIMNSAIMVQYLDVTYCLIFLLKSSALWLPIMYDIHTYNIIDRYLIDDADSLVYSTTNWLYWAVIGMDNYRAYLPFH